MKKSINISELMQQSGVQFGTSGARGLVEDMTDEVCFLYSVAFLQYLSSTDQFEAEGCVGIGGDLRPSTDRIMAAVKAAVLSLNCKPVMCGYLASPALAYYGMNESIPTLMVTGSHIPDDRNGIKFNTAAGEILKQDEIGIKNQIVEYDTEWFSDGKLVKTFVDAEVDTTAQKLYIKRFTDFFPKDALSGFKVGLYEHSSVVRSAMFDVLTRLGAEVLKLGYSDAFIPVDTEAVRAEDIVLAKQWVSENHLDCIVSADGDGDRPLISNEKGQYFRGDVVGVLTAWFLGAQNVVTPVSSNTLVEKLDKFNEVVRTKIGSPYVVEAMKTLVDETKSITVGYEANGGFLQHNDIEMNGRTLKALPTRDAMIVPICVLLLARQLNVSLSGLLDLLPQRFTASDRIKNIPTKMSREMIERFTASAQFNENASDIEKVFSAASGKVASLDMTDGLRISFENNEIIHLRPSGNAPELRCYCEAESPERVESLLTQSMKIVLDLV